MTTSQKSMRKHYYLFALAIILFVIVGVTLYLGNNNFEIRSIGLVVCMISVYLVRISNIHVRSSSVNIDKDRAELTQKNRPKLVMWLIGIMLLAALEIARYLLQQDALAGYKETFPVYLFAGTAVVCAAFWAYLISRFF